MSFGLCDLYYAHVLTDVFSDFFGPDLRHHEGFIRYHDDVVFFSWDPDRVKR
jgi:hypothetical protein